MKPHKQGRFIYLDGSVFEKGNDGILIPVIGKTDWARLDTMTPAETEAIADADEDGLPMSDEEWLAASPSRPAKVPVGLKLDQDVLLWFKAQGRGYQSRINDILRRYMDAHSKKAG